MTNKPSKVLIVGGGFGGLFTALDLINHAEVTLISDENHFVFKPLLYEYMSGEVEAWHIAPHYNELLDEKIHFIQGEVSDIDLEKREASLEGRDYKLQYDALVLAVGGRTNYWNVQGAEQHTMPFRTIADADALRRRMTEALDHIPPDAPPQVVRDALAFAIVGGGASGVELATKMSDLLYDACQRRALKGEPRVIIIEMASEVVPGMGNEIRAIVEKALKQARVELYLQTRVVNVGPDQLTVEHDGTQREIKTTATVWVAGVRVNPLVEKLNVEKDERGLIVVEPTLRVKGQENVFAIGDITLLADIPPILAGTAQLAFQQASLLTENVRAFIEGRELKTKKFHELGEAVSLGIENAAVLTQGGVFSGALARQARFALYSSRLPTWQHRIKVGASWFFEGTTPRPLQPLGF
jgi:NADH dehydrogenase